MFNKNKNKKFRKIIKQMGKLMFMAWVSGGIIFSNLNSVWAVSPVPTEAKSIFIEDVSIVDGVGTAYVSLNIPTGEEIWFIKTYGLKYDKDLITVNSISVENAIVATWTNQAFIKNYSAFGIIRFQYGRSAIITGEEPLVGDGTKKNIFKIDFTVKDENKLPTSMLLDFSTTDSNTILKDENGTDITANYVLYDDVVINKTTEGVIDYSQDVDSTIIMPGSDWEIVLNSDNCIVRFNGDQKMNLSAGAKTTVDTTISWMSIKQALSDLAGETVDSLKTVKLKKGVSAILDKFIIEADNFEVELADGVDIYTDSCWNEQLKTPKNIKNDISREWFIVNEALSLGWDVIGKCGVMVLSEPAKIIIPEIIGTPLYSNDGGTTWTQIVECSWGSADGPGTLSFPEECFVKVWSETIVWTYHFTDFWMMVPGENYANTQLKMELNKGEITIGWPTWIIFPNIMASSQEETVNLVSLDYFWVEDLKGTDNGYYTTLGVSDLIGSIGSSIPANRFYWKIDNPASVKIALDGSDNDNVEIPSGDVGDIGYDYTALEDPTIYIERKNGVNYKIGKYGVKPSFKVIIPAYKRIGSYTGNITYTLIEN